MKPNQKVMVSYNNPLHGWRIGYFQYFGKGSASNCAVLSDTPVNENQINSREYFVVHRDDIQIINDSQDSQVSV